MTIITYTWEQRKLKDFANLNPKTKLPNEFEYVDLESVIGTNLKKHRLEKRVSAPSRAKRVASYGDIFYQMVRPYQKNNYLFVLKENNYVFSTGYAQIRPLINSSFLFNTIQRESFVNIVLNNCTGTSYPAINPSVLSEITIKAPNNLCEQKAIGNLINQIDNLITLHQRK